MILLTVYLMHPFILSNLSVSNTAWCLMGKRSHCTNKAEGCNLKHGIIFLENQDKVFL